MGLSGIEWDRAGQTRINNKTHISVRKKGKKGKEWEREG